jgi:hypothetical protein
MARLALSGLIVAAACGCAPVPYWMPSPLPSPAVVHDNPTLLPIRDPQLAWETVVDVVDDYFQVRREEPVRVVEGAATPGRLETVEQVSPTWLEPWRRDTVGPYERLESTLQTMRRRAVVHVSPAEGGYWVEVQVFKELEGLRRPEHATAGAATFRYDESLTRVVDPIDREDRPETWIPQGRDTVLEQWILGHLQARANEVAAAGPWCPPGMGQ